MSIHGIKRPKLNSYWKKWEGESKAIYIHTHRYIYLLVFTTDINEQPGEEVHKARSGSVPLAEASVPLELGREACDSL